MRIATPNGVYDCVGTLFRKYYARCPFSTTLTNPPIMGGTPNLEGVEAMHTEQACNVPGEGGK